MNPEIKEYLNKQAELLPVNRSISQPEAERRAVIFLETCAKIADWRHLLSEGKIQSVTMQSVVYAEELSKCTGKTVTENKITVEAHPKYTGAREEFESVENDLSYLKAMLDVFLNGHLFYRAMAKESFGG
jgi:hypothetical protein